jgi:hypothetical protein
MVCEERLRAGLRKECEAMVDELMAVMERTPDTNIIGGSEWGVQAVVTKTKRALFQRLVEAKARSADAQLRASFSPCGQGFGPGQGQEAAQQG